LKLLEHFGFYFLWLFEKIPHLFWRQK